MIFSITAITEPYPTAYAGKDSEKDLCKENDEEWEDGRCEIEDEEQEQEFLNDVASLEDSICEDDELKDIDREDWIDLYENINVFINK